MKSTKMLMNEQEQGEATKEIGAQTDLVFDQNETERIMAWRKYIQHLFNDTRPEPPELADTTGSDILIDEVDAAIKSMKEGRSPGPDNINAEFLNLLGDDSSAGLDAKNIAIMTNLYWNQSTAVRIESESSEETKILRGVRQGCIISPLLFNMYSECIFNEALENIESGILLNGDIINNIRYADDTVIFAGSLEGLQELMDKITQSSQLYGLDMYINKSKFMVICKEKVINCQLTNIKNILEGSCDKQRSSQKEKPKKKEIVNTVKIRKPQFLGHIMRNDNFNSDVKFLPSLDVDFHLQEIKPDELYQLKAAIGDNNPDDKNYTIFNHYSSTSGLGLQAETLPSLQEEERRCDPLNAAVIFDTIKFNNGSAILEPHGESLVCYQSKNQWNKCRSKQVEFIKQQEP
ncbi:hypothetical protein HUJ04_008234 [Dendroctonus ponderosae]|nr:hypothetical protein HUJ04_008234 [Dendroctonus ponderosae]